MIPSFRSAFVVLRRSLVAAFLALVLLAFFLETLDRALVQPMGNYARSLRKLAKARPHVEILILGQSDVGEAVLDDEIGKAAFNFAWGGETLPGTYYKLRNHLDRLPRLKLLVLALPLCSFTSARADMIRIEHYVYHIEFRDLPELARVNGRTVWGRKLLGLVSFLDERRMADLPDRLRKAAKEYGKRRRGEKKKDGQEERALLAWPVEEETRELVATHFVNRNPFDPGLLHYFHKILGLARDRKIPLVLLTCPVTGGYLRGAAPYVTMEEMRRRVLDQPEARAEFFRHLDYADAYAGQPEYFKNPDHMSRAGAAVFSARFRKDLERIRLELDSAKRDAP